MGAFEKLPKRFLSKPKDFTCDEITRLLSSLGYEKKLIQNNESLRYKRAVNREKLTEKAETYQALRNTGKSIQDAYRMTGFNGELHGSAP